MDEFQNRVVFAYLEEDNTQRAFFRAFPLLSEDGEMQTDAASKWADDGALRIIPDSNEHRSFRDRMLNMGLWCCIDLTTFGEEAKKVRPNKRYQPGGQEHNQYIVYSDAIRATGDGPYFEVLGGKPEQAEALAASAITDQFFIREGDIFYGPVSKAKPEIPQPAEPMNLALYTAFFPDQKEHQVACKLTEPAAESEMETTPAEAPAQEESEMPVQEITEQTAAEAAEAVPEVPAAETTPEEPQKKPQEKPGKREKDKARREREKDKDKDNKDKEREPEKAKGEALPIGEALNILDQTKSYEQTIRELDQPLSAGANLLTTSQEDEATETVRQPSTVKLNGTPLTKVSQSGAAVSPKNHAQAAVAAQRRQNRNDGSEPSIRYRSDLPLAENPVREVAYALREVWANGACRQQLLDEILSLDDIQNALRSRGVKLNQADDQLAEMESERIELLVQLDLAKKNLSAALSKASSKARRELTELEEACAKAREELASVRQEILAASDETKTEG